SLLTGKNTGKFMKTDGCGTHSHPTSPEFGHFRQDSLHTGTENFRRENRECNFRNRNLSLVPTSLAPLARTRPRGSLPCSPMSAFGGKADIARTCFDVRF